MKKDSSRSTHWAAIRFEWDESIRLQLDTRFRMFLRSSIGSNARRPTSTYPFLLLGSPYERSRVGCHRQLPSQRVGRSPRSICLDVFASLGRRSGFLFARTKR